MPTLNALFDHLDRRWNTELSPRGDLLADPVMDSESAERVKRVLLTKITEPETEGQQLARLNRLAIRCSKFIGEEALPMVTDTDEWPANIDSTRHDASRELKAWFDRKLESCMPRIEKDVSAMSADLQKAWHETKRGWRARWYGQISQATSKYFRQQTATSATFDREWKNKGAKPCDFCGWIHDSKLTHFVSRSRKCDIRAGTKPHRAIVALHEHMTVNRDALMPHNDMAATLQYDPKDVHSYLQNVFKKRGDLLRVLVHNVRARYRLKHPNESRPQTASEKRPKTRRHTVRRK